MATGKSVYEESETKTAKTVIHGESPEPSCVSMKSDWSMKKPLSFSETDSSSDVSASQRESPEPSGVSIKSDWSMKKPPSFGETDPISDVSVLFGKSPEASCVSMKSDWSMKKPPSFSETDPISDVSVLFGKSPEASCVSMKTDWSMKKTPSFSETDPSADVSVFHGESPEPGCASMKSVWSMTKLPSFSETDPSADVRNKEDELMRCELSYAKKKQLDSIFTELENKIIFLIKKELKSFKNLLRPDDPAHSESKEKDDGQKRVRDGVLKITLHVLRKMKQTDLANMLQTKLAPLCMKKHKSRIKEKFQIINEGILNPGSATLLHGIYTELYITKGGTGEVNTEHEVRQMETSTRSAEIQETSIKCKDMFKGRNKPIRTVLTTGVSGIGKTVSVQKFILDWAEGKENQDLHFIFPLPFRELNLIKDKNLSLLELLRHFFTDIKKMRLTDLDDFKVLFIFDGLDECRFPLDFPNNQNLSDVTESAALDVLLTNLIKGNLLPSALIWITSRPAAADQIPPEFVDQVTDVRGFNDPQKDEYFRKRINDESLASTIITHIKSSRSLYIMCHIPVFCWVSATVLERMLGGTESAEIPKTLTQMFTQFLIFQIRLKFQKYDGKSEVDPQQARQSILSLGKLAFEQLEKGNMIFYEEDVRECGIDVREASVYSGVCTQIFKEGSGIYLGKVFSFVHLTIQEFIAALYVFLLFVHRATNLNSFYQSTLIDFLKRAVDRAMQSENGHLDLFLRFLMGLSLESNQTIIRGLFTFTERISHSPQEIVEYIKQKIRENPSPEKSINLFHCLNELNDHSLVQEVQTYLSRAGARHLHGFQLSPSHWSALVFVLLYSEEELNQFTLSKYIRSEECLLRLLPVIKASTKANLSGCNLTERSCSALTAVLSSNSSNLKELNLSHNKLQDSGMKLLSAGLENSNCYLETLILTDCRIGEEGCAFLASALTSNPSHLRELNLNFSTLGNVGIKLSDVLTDPQCRVEKLKLNNCSIPEEGCAALASALRSNPSHLTELNLGLNKLGDSGVKGLSDLLENPQCKLQKLQLFNCSIPEGGCAALASALISNPSHLTELNLGYNNLRDLGIKLLSKLLENPQCKLKKLKLYNCHIGAKGCAALFSALRVNPSNLAELDLSCNKPECSALQLLSDLLKDPNCKLEKLQLSSCCIEETGCAALVSALRSKPTHLRELNLRCNKFGDSGDKLLSDLQKDPRCKLEKLHKV
ncbi:NACHT, LRR and PYD domains-containing protein 12-like isoform X2 [Triplophysa rosa]|uniref:NACHT, LRR and PYD domains-containing protein 12-like isoform X2 n=1 Tax=Triplophysa rosa TaxID=992332 RepID=UPI002545CC82|nr:NACHT, LRR and PYD domains-containing protein 12-like isoform X2 [Triplophysa rosa]